MAIIFYFADVPDLNTEDQYHLSDSESKGFKRSIWSHPHFACAVAAQFFYVAAQAGIFSFFINYIIEELPSISQSIAGSWFLKDRAILHDGGYFINEQGATFLLGTIGFPLFLLGRATGAVLLRKLKAHRVLGTYAFVNVLLCGLVGSRLLRFFLASFLCPLCFPLSSHWVFSGWVCRRKRRRDSLLWLSSAVLLCPS
jgi:FHS family L-fucose permease-like MFS transporter